MPHLLEPFAREGLQASGLLGWVLGQHLPLLLLPQPAFLLSLACALAPAHKPDTLTTASPGPAAPRATAPHSPWPGTGPGTPVGLWVDLEALQPSLAGAGVGIFPQGKVGLQPGKGDVGSGMAARKACHPPPWGPSSVFLETLSHCVGSPGWH